MSNPAVVRGTLDNLGYEAKSSVLLTIACRLLQLIAIIAQAILVFYVVGNPGYWHDLEFPFAMAFVTVALGAPLSVHHIVISFPRRGHVWMVFDARYDADNVNVKIRYKIYMILDLLLVTLLCTFLATTTLDKGKEFRHAFDPPPVRLWGIMGGIVGCSVLLSVLGFLLVLRQGRIMEQFQDLRAANRAIQLEDLPPTYTTDDPERPRSPQASVHPAHFV